MEFYRKHIKLLALIPAIVLWGCFGGICLAGVNSFLQAIWTPALTFNYSFSLGYQIQIIITSALILWLLGTMAAELFCRDSVKNLPDILLTGSLSGICSALVYVSISVYQEILSRPLTVYYTNDLFLMRSFLDRLFHPWLITLAGFILVSAILQILGIWYNGSHHESRTDRKESQKSVIASTIHRQRFLLLALIAVLIIPPGFVCLGMETGYIDKNPSCCTIIADSANVSRTGPFSIRIEMVPDPVQSISSPVPSIKIFIDGKDFSNRSVITGSGYDVGIDPPEGLRYHKGAFVIVQGKDLPGNDTAPVRVMILVAYPDQRGSAVIFDRDI